MASYSRTPRQAAAIQQQERAGFAISRELPSKVELRKGGQVVVVWMDGSVRRGDSGYQKVVRREA